jgi:serine/threonine protein kinase/tetratricopeptide (TPR) repeat protein
MNKELATNTTLSHYRIVSKIGAGGMGEVYLAQDTRLDRKVAIKFLHEEFSKDADKLNRFIQEAKAASALNHPNILTVYEIGEVDGKNYIATELIDGKTLREHLSHQESLPLNTILKIGVQVAEALSAAHQAGIIHRDIKPENIMLRKDGYAKVLDFGLAKLSEPAAVATRSAGSEDATRVQVNTTPGLVMGTVSYMSPEQARGKVTDARTDIWSLGVVLYEMLAGKVPFTGETINHTIVSILEREPLLLENVPAELQRIVRKSLTKDMEMRYQSARDLLIDLKNLRRELDLQGELERSVVPNRETTNTSLENATQMYASNAVAATKSGQAAATHSVTTSSSSLEYAVTQAKSHKLVTAIVGLVLLAAISAIGYFGFVYKRSGTGQSNSIAVLPFQNSSGKADSEYLSDGLTESLIYRLSQLPNVKVSPASSVFRYKGKEVDTQKVAAELGVNSVMSGRLMQRGDNLTISVELIDAANNKILWGEHYERKMSELLATQREIATAITEKLQLKLSGDDAKGVTKKYTESNEAYQLYLKGRFYWNKRTVDGLTQAAVYYKQAIEKDPGYALAYSGLAETYVLYSNYSVALPKDSMPQAKAAALKALELDDSLAEPHAALGTYLSAYGWDQSAAEREFRRAIELKPNYATAYHWLGITLALAKRPDEAIATARHAEELDPLSLIISADTAFDLILSRRYDEAILQGQRALTLDPNFYYTHYLLGWAYYEKGMYREAISECRKSLEVNEEPYAKAILITALSKSGGRAEAIKLRDELKSASTRHYVPSYFLAVADMALGERDEAFAALEKDFAERSTSYSWIPVDPLFDDLRNDPRFKALMQRVESSKLD